ncbi:hypothetical protein [Alienimonas californiensis]|uniref:Uncharacterized protein n=1 Tax=Alienimonas californiensis TaxID=2527989 RepID=A0A517P7A8_9PLAN|nr:hypothetical protein [Alienimonas californiensis]QDT15269.1 hypothetical protein CA12_13520 [Alienimonas californiensis]
MFRRTDARPPRPESRPLRACLAVTALAGAWAIGCGVAYPHVVEPLRVDEVFTTAELTAAPIPGAAVRFKVLERQTSRAALPILGGALTLIAAVVALLFVWRDAWPSVSVAVVAVAAATGFLGALLVLGPLFFGGDIAAASNAMDTILTPAERAVPATYVRSEDMARRYFVEEARRDAWLLWTASLPLALAGTVVLWAIMRVERARGRDEPIDLFPSESPRDPHRGET